MPQSRVKACNECRQQKLRCDTNKQTSEPCSRCKELALQCVVSPIFQRSKRQSKADLRKEIHHLKSVLLSSDGHGGRPRAEENSTSSEVNQPLAPHDAVSPGSPVSISLGQSSAAPKVALPNLHNDSTAISVISSTDGSTTTSVRASTHQQSIDGYLVEGSKIFDCFMLFYQDYAPWLPGMFDQTITPNEHFQSSPLLFWTIVGTGARRYKKDPTIFDRISKRMTEKLGSFACVMVNPSAAVQAIVVLCTWPLPVTTIFKDFSPSWAGLGTAVAVQAGLHAICIEEEFAQKPATVRPLVGTPAARSLYSDASSATNAARAKVAFRTSIWINSVIACQSLMLCDGLPPICIPTNVSPERQQLIGYMLDNELNLRYRLHVIQTDAVAAIRRTIDLESVSCGPDLISLISIFDDQLKNITINSADTIGTINRDCARLMVLSFHFFVQNEYIDKQGFLQVFSTAQRIILQINERDITHAGFARYLPIYYSRTVFLAACCILRISKSRLKDELRLHDADETFFKAIDILRQRSVQNGDLDALGSIMLTKLWSSDQIFVQPDGARNSLQLNLRGRLMMSVTFDCFWWWRKEFGYLFNDSIPCSRDSNKEDVETCGEKSSLPYSAGIPEGTVAHDGYTFPPNTDEFPDISEWDWNVGLTPFESMVI